MYIEFVIADNFLLTYLAGRAGSRFCHDSSSVLRTVIAATVGSGVALCYPFISGVWVELAVKIALWLVLCAIMYWGTPKKILKGIMFLLCTFALGGACYALSFCVSGRVARFLSTYPIFPTAGLGCILYALVKIITKRLTLIRARKPYMYKTEVEYGGQTLMFSAFLDTGNCVFDERSGLPVIITDVNTFVSKLSAGNAVKFSRELSKLRTQSFCSPAGKSKIYMLSTRAVTVYSDNSAHKINAMIGLVGGGAFTREREMLLGPSVVSEGV